jgi:hypothetical protein
MYSIRGDERASTKHCSKELSSCRESRYKQNAVWKLLQHASWIEHVFDAAGRIDGRLSYPSEMEQSRSQIQILLVIYQFFSVCLFVCILLGLDCL